MDFPQAISRDERKEEETCPRPGPLTHRLNPPQVHLKVLLFKSALSGGVPGLAATNDAFKEERKARLFIINSTELKDMNCFD